MPRRGVQGAHSFGWACSVQIVVDLGVQTAVQKRLECGHPKRGLSMGNRWLLVGEIVERLGGTQDAACVWLNSRGLTGRMFGRLSILGHFNLEC